MLFKLNFIIIEYRMKVVCVNKHTAIYQVDFVLDAKDSFRFYFVLFFQNILFNNSEAVVNIYIQ